MLDHFGFAVPADADVMAWARNHDSHRTSAWTRLDSIRAVRK
jgi:hypothetical protein